MGLFGFDSISDMFDGGGAGQSGSSYSTEGSIFDSTPTRDEAGNRVYGKAGNEYVETSGATTSGAAPVTDSSGQTVTYPAGHPKVGQPVMAATTFTPGPTLEDKSWWEIIKTTPSMLTKTQQDKIDTIVADNEGSSYDGNAGIIMGPDGRIIRDFNADPTSIDAVDTGRGSYYIPNISSSGGSSAGGSFSPQQILEYAKAAGMVESDAQIAELLADPMGWLESRNVKLSDIVPTLDPETTGANLDPNNPNYDLGDDPTYNPTTVADVDVVSDVSQGPVTTFDAATVTDRLGTDATTVNAATGSVSDDATVQAEQIDLTGAATGVNADGTISVTGEALNQFATQDISTIIDTTTVAGKLLAQKLGEGNYTDAKATVLGQMKIISDEFKNPTTGEPIIPPWAQALARDTARTMAFGGITGTARTAAISTALMEATLGVAEKDAIFFQTLTTKNLDNRQQATINRANVLSKFEVANLDNRQAAAVQNAKSFLEMDLQNLTNEQQAEVVNTQAMVEAIFNDQSAINAARLFSAEANNDFQKYYDNLTAQIEMHRSEQLNSMKRFNAGEQNDAAEFNAKLEDSRDQFYSTMQYNIDLANAKWRQTVATTTTQMAFEAATTDVKNTLDISQEAMNQMWDRVDNMLDYIFKGWNAEADRDVTILASQMKAQSASSGGKNQWIDGAFKLGAAWIASSDRRLKDNIEYYDTLKGINFYTWDWNDEAKKLGLDRYPSMGVIAQEIQKKNPDAVIENEHGYLMVNYGMLQ